MLGIDKRNELYNQLKKGNKNEKQLKKFIEILLSNDFDTLENIFMNTYISLKSIIYYLRNKSDEYIFTQREIIRGVHEYYFMIKSQYMRNISYYNEYDPLQKFRGNLKNNSTLISFYTKYPQKIKKYYGDKFKIINYFLENEYEILSEIFKIISLRKKQYENRFNI